MQQTTIWEGDTEHGHFEIVDTRYDGRTARVLYSGDRQAAQSGLALDDSTDLLFDYNQRMFELATCLAPAHILLVGGGVGTLPTALLAALPDVQIDMVEPDPGLITLGHRFFGLPVDARLSIFTTDGRTFLREHVSRYDLVLVDAFHHTTIPTDVKTLEAFQAYAKHLKRGGVLAMNVISGYYGPSAQVLAQVSAAAYSAFKTVDVFLASRGYSLWLPQNFVLAAQKDGELPLRDYVRHDAVAPPQVGPNDALHDA